MMPMTRRRLLLFGLPAALVLVGVGVWALWPRQSLITVENAARIRQGMMSEEVEAILGGPPRDESTGQLKDLGDWIRPFRDFNRETANIGPKAWRFTKVWRSNCADVRVELDG